MPVFTMNITIRLNEPHISSWTQRAKRANQCLVFNRDTLTFETMVVGGLNLHNIENTGVLHATNGQTL